MNPERARQLASPALQRLLVTIFIMMATIMQVLDITIANVSLPYMQGSLSATLDQVSWVLTSYVVAAAVMTSPVGWLATRYGIKKLLIVCVTGFTVASMLCGVAQNIEEMVRVNIVNDLAVIMSLRVNEVRRDEAPSGPLQQAAFSPPGAGLARSAYSVGLGSHERQRSSRLLCVRPAPHHHRLPACLPLRSRPRRSWPRRSSTCWSRSGDASIPSAYCLRNWARSSNCDLMPSRAST